MAETATGTRDEHYNLMSVLYHTLRGADVIERYIQDARGNNDDELARFFEDVQEQDRQRAEQAKKLLASRINQMVR